jgi:hypothetical protein
LLAFQWFLLLCPEHELAASNIIFLLGLRIS